MYNWPDSQIMTPLLNERLKPAPPWVYKIEASPTMGLHLDGFISRNRYTMSYKVFCLNPPI